MLKIAEKIWHSIELNKMEFFVQHNFPLLQFHIWQKIILHIETVELRYNV